MPKKTSLRYGFESALSDNATLVAWVELLQIFGLEVAAFDTPSDHNSPSHTACTPCQPSPSSMSSVSHAETIESARIRGIIPGEYRTMSFSPLGRHITKLDSETGDVASSDVSDTALLPALPYHGGVRTPEVPSRIQETYDKINPFPVDPLSLSVISPIVKVRFSKNDKIDKLKKLGNVVFALRLPMTATMKSLSFDYNSLVEPSSPSPMSRDDPSGSTLTDSATPQALGSISSARSHGPKIQTKRRSMAASGGRAKKSIPRYARATISSMCKGPDPHAIKGWLKRKRGVGLVTPAKRKFQWSAE